MNLTESVSVVAIANGIRRLGLEKTVFKALVEAHQDEVVDEACGLKYGRSNREKKFERAATTTRIVKTMLGESVVNVVKVRERASGNVRALLWERVLLSPRRVYQDDVVLVGCELVTKMTYRDAVMEAKRFQPEFPSRHTLQRRLPEFGLELDSMNEALNGFDVIVADGTKARSTLPRGHHEVNVVMGTRGGEKRLLRVSVGETWEHTSIRVKDQIDKAAVVVADGEREIHAAFQDIDLPVQQCLLHALRHVHFAMLKDGASREERNAKKKELTTLLVILRASVKKHFQDKDWARLEWRVNKTREEIHLLADNLIENGWTTAGAFLKRETDGIVLFARLAPTRDDVPWTTNLVERVMGEISKRVKHKWMHWSELGLDALLNMLLTRLKNPDVYDAWWNQKMRAEETPDLRAEILHVLKAAQA